MYLVPPHDKEKRWYIRLTTDCDYEAYSQILGRQLGASARVRRDLRDGRLWFPSFAALELTYFTIQSQSWALARKKKIGNTPVSDLPRVEQKERTNGGDRA